MCNFVSSVMIVYLFPLCVFYITNKMQTYTAFFIIIGALHVLGRFSAHHQELVKLYVHINEAMVAGTRESLPPLLCLPQEYTHIHLTLCCYVFSLVICP